VKNSNGKSPIILSTLAFFVLTLPLVFAVSAKEDSSSAGAVFIMTNSSAGNSVLAYGRGADGSLSFLSSFPTGDSAPEAVSATKVGSPSARAADGFLP